jgi:predicted MPP superfamily phosphohydrolase
LAIWSIRELKINAKKVVTLKKSILINVMRFLIGRKEKWEIIIYVEIPVYLSELYAHRASYCIMFLSEHYAKKLWTNHERKAAQSRAFRENKAYILPIRLDSTEIPGIPETVGYLNWHDEGAEKIASYILLKLGKMEK